MMDGEKIHETMVLPTYIAEMINFHYSRALVDTAELRRNCIGNRDSKRLCIEEDEEEGLTNASSTLPNELRARVEQKHRKTFRQP